MALNHFIDVSVKKGAVFRYVTFRLLLQPLYYDIILHAERATILDLGDLVKCLKVVFEQVDVDYRLQKYKFRILTNLRINLLGDVEDHSGQIVLDILFPLWQKF